MSDLHQDLKKFIIEAMNLEDVTTGNIDDDLALFSEDGLGLDSIDALELVLALKKSYGITLEANDEKTRQHLRSVATLAKLVRSHRAVETPAIHKRSNQ
jgi:acyl carrier protein